MKVIKVYDKDSDIRSYNRNVFRATESLLATFPYEYGENYRHNLETLELIQVDKFTDNSMTGYYDDQANVIFFTKKMAVGHELFHMASNDLEEGTYAFQSKMQMELGLIEGMTEYFAVKAYDLEIPGAYPFEVFCVTMLEDIPNIFKPYFIPNNKEFISLFPNRRDIYSLLYSLDAYNEMYSKILDNEYNKKDDDINITLFRNTIKDVFNSLIEIELSLEKDPHMLRQYDFKFMEYLGGKKLELLFNKFYPKYYEYADKLIDKKIRKRKM